MKLLFILGLWIFCGMIAFVLSLGNKTKSDPLWKNILMGILFAPCFLLGILVGYLNFLHEILEAKGYPKLVLYIINVPIMLIMTPVMGIAWLVDKSR